MHICDRRDQRYIRLIDEAALGIDRPLKWSQHWDLVDPKTLGSEQEARAELRTEVGTSLRYIQTSEQTVRRAIGSMPGDAPSPAHWPQGSRVWQREPPWRNRRARGGSRADLAADHPERIRSRFRCHVRPQERASIVLALAEDEVRYAASVRALAAHESGRAQTPPRVWDLKEEAQMVIYTFKDMPYQRGSGGGTFACGALRRGHRSGEASGRKPPLAAETLSW